MGEVLNLGAGLRDRHARASFDEPRASTAGAVRDPLTLLLAETAAGREASFARLYELTAGRLLSVARGIVGGRTDVAEDILQESFIRVWRWAHSYEPEKGAAYAWLVRIVRNRALSARERLHRREDGHAEPDAETLVAEEIDPADRAMRSEDARRVNACLANLPANHRRALELVYFEGLTHRELAGRLSVQLGTAKSWVRRGLAQMGRCLGAGAETGWQELVSAEYAIGSLQGAVGRGFARRRERDARYCRAVDKWEDRFALLTETLSATPLPPQLWSRIQRQIARERIGVARTLSWRAVTVSLVLGLFAIALLLFW